VALAHCLPSFRTCASMMMVPPLTRATMLACRHLLSQVLKGKASSLTCVALWFSQAWCDLSTGASCSTVARCITPSVAVSCTPSVAVSCSRLEAAAAAGKFCQCRHAPHSARKGWGLCADWCGSGRGRSQHTYIHTYIHTRGRSQYGIGLGLIKANGPWGFLALPNALYGILYYVALGFTQLPSTFVASLFTCLLAPECV
jgi:hypothetical protein